VAKVGWQHPQHPLPSTDAACETIQLRGMATLQAIKYQRGSLSLLDQRLLPFETVYLPVPDPQTAWQHIKDMVVRGAPAIGVTGALALAVDLVAKGAGSQFGSVHDTVKGISETLDFLVTRWDASPCIGRDAAGKCHRSARLPGRPA
jgi:hypothetical protein